MAWKSAACYGARQRAAAHAKRSRALTTNELRDPNSWYNLESKKANWRLKWDHHDPNRFNFGGELCWNRGLRYRKGNLCSWEAVSPQWGRYVVERLQARTAELRNNKIILLEEEEKEIRLFNPDGFDRNTEPLEFFRERLEELCFLANPAPSWGWKESGLRIMPDGILVENTQKYSIETHDLFTPDPRVLKEILKILQKGVIVDDRPVQNRIIRINPYDLNYYIEFDNTFDKNNPFVLSTIKDWKEVISNQVDRFSSNPNYKYARDSGEIDYKRVIST